VVAFVITAFVAPGFLLSDDDDDSTSGGGGNSSGAQALAEKIRDGLIANDTATLQQLACPDATDMVQGAIHSASELADVRIDGQAQENGDTATVKATVTLDGVGVETGITNTFAKQNGEWCWQDLTFNVSNMPGPGEMSDIPSMPPAPSIPSVPSPGSPGSASDIGSSGSSGGVEAFLQQFGEALNAGDAETLQGMLCPAATGAEEIEKPSQPATTTRWRTASGKKAPSSTLVSSAPTEGSRSTSTARTNRSVFSSPSIYDHVVQARAGSEIFAPSPFLM
jgi:hypothetical protein